MIIDFIFGCDLTREECYESRVQGTNKLYEVYESMRFSSTKTVS